jgi:HD-GYP domain-containing protein (c-di-GMP phosphodiesterase class II)
MEIGKVGIPYAILNKQAALTVEEAEVLKLHTVIGQRILEQVEWTRRLAPFIRHHHENWDGSGYPDGLQGEEIPLASRILHVVDDFVVTMRGKPLDNVALRWQAVQQMEHHVGRKYDPRVFEALRPIVRKEVFDRINHCHLSDA